MAILAKGPKLWDRVCGKDGQDLIDKYIRRIFDWGTIAISALAVLMVILGGYRLMTSTGNPDAIQTGYKMIGSAITGIVLVIFSQVILRAINPQWFD